MLDKVRVKTALEALRSPTILLPIMHKYIGIIVFGAGTIYEHILNKINNNIDGVCLPFFHLQAFHSPLPETLSAVCKPSEYPEVKQKARLKEGSLAVLCWYKLLVFTLLLFSICRES